MRSDQRELGKGAPNAAAWGVEGEQVGAGGRPAVNAKKKGKGEEQRGIVLSKRVTRQMP